MAGGGLEEGRLLRLRVEMRLPGRAWLQFHVEHDGAGTGAEAGGGRTRLRQRATFAPRGLPGQLYWRGIAPFHGVVFGGMIRNISRVAQRAQPA